MLNFTQLHHIVLLAAKHVDISQPLIFRAAGNEKALHHLQQILYPLSSQHMDSASFIKNAEQTLQLSSLSAYDWAAFVKISMQKTDIFQICDNLKALSAWQVLTQEIKPFLFHVMSANHAQSNENQHNLPRKKSKKNKLKTDSEKSLPIALSNDVFSHLSPEVSKRMAQAFWRFLGQIYLNGQMKSLEALYEVLHLAYLTIQAKDNGMDAKAVAVVFSPSLLHALNLNQALIVDMQMPDYQHPQEYELMTQILNTLFQNSLSAFQSSSAFIQALERHNQGDKFKAYYASAKTSTQLSKKPLALNTHNAELTLEQAQILIKDELGLGRPSIPLLPLSQLNSEEDDTAMQTMATRLRRSTSSPEHPIKFKK